MRSDLKQHWVIYLEDHKAIIVGQNEMGMIQNYDYDRVLHGEYDSKEKAQKRADIINGYVAKLLHSQYLEKLERVTK